jgi:sugar-specific transcriptional regulator TrmB
VVVYIIMTRGSREITQTQHYNTWQGLCDYLGLSEYEAKIYVALIKAGYANARTPSAASGVPRTKVYSVLRKLVSINLVVEIPEEPRRFSPVSPEVAFKTYLESYKSKVDNIVSVISTLDEIFRKTKRGEILHKGELWVIIGKQQILKKIREMLSKAKYMVDLVTNENGLILLYNEFNRFFDELVERSIKVWIITPHIPNNQHMLSELRHMCNVQQTNFELPMIFLCIDEQQFLLTNLQTNSLAPDFDNCKAIFSDDSVLLNFVRSLAIKKRVTPVFSRLSSKEM